MFRYVQDEEIPNIYEFLVKANEARFSSHDRRDMTDVDDFIKLLDESFLLDLVDPEIIVLPDVFKEGDFLSAFEHPSLFCTNKKDLQNRLFEYHRVHTL